MIHVFYIDVLGMCVIWVNIKVEKLKLRNMIISQLHIMLLISIVIKFINLLMT